QRKKKRKGAQKHRKALAKRVMRRGDEKEAFLQIKRRRFLNEGVFGERRRRKKRGEGGEGERRGGEENVGYAGEAR
ncbi:hypothetical protein, partial [Yersinia pestis]|uniref:hypothetical protein n=1 Tax=Yersinia pestis TaxID=632 RepID=UPI001A7EF7E3